MKVLTLLNARRRPSAPLRLRAKAKMCANGEVICHEEYCRFAQDYFGKLEDLAARAAAARRARRPSSPTSLRRRAAPPRSARSRSASTSPTRAQVVVCDYNYAFDPYVGALRLRAPTPTSPTPSW